MYSREYVPYVASCGHSFCQKCAAVLSRCPACRQFPVKFSKNYALAEALESCLYDWAPADIWKLATKAGTSRISNYMQYIQRVTIEYQDNEYDFRLCRNVNMLNVLGNDGMTPLMRALCSFSAGDIDALGQMIATAACDIRDRCGQTALMYATLYYSNYGEFAPQILCSLLEHSTPDLQDTNGFTALTLAAKTRYGDMHPVATLAQACNQNILTNEAQSALMLAAENNTTSVIAACNTCDWTLCDSRGDSVAAYALRNRYPDAASALAYVASQYPIQDAHGRTFLMHIAISGNLQHIKHVALDSAYCNMQDNTGTNALMHAVKAGQTAIANRLICVTNCNARDNCGLTALMHAARLGKHAQIATLAKHSNTRLCDYERMNALMHAASSRQPDAVNTAKLLAEYGGHSAVDKYDRTVLMHAIYGQKLALVKMFAYQSHIVDKDKRTALMHAAKGGTSGIVKYLLKTGDISLHDNYGKTAYDYSIRNENIDDDTMVLLYVQPRLQQQIANPYTGHDYSSDSESD